jgi:TolB-like protein/Flp pilus assembly protein TadD
MSGLIQELKRRNVFKVGTAYVVMAWLIAQAADVFLEPLGVPEWFIQSLLILLLIGFPVTLVLAWVYELTPEGIKKEKDVDRSQSITRQTGQKLNLTIIAVLALAVGLLLFDRFRPKEAVEEQTAPTDAVVTETSGRPSIAVLPFVNMSSDQEQEYFSDGISEEILNALAKVKELKVAGRTSSFAFKGKNQDLRQIGETLGVAHILEGSVRKSGDTVRITAQLIHAEDGFHLWSETYDRVLTDVFAVQDEIANAILEQMKSNLLADVAAVKTESVTDPEVYNLYLMARQRMYSRSEPALQSAQKLLDEAVARDSSYAPAFAQRGIVPLLLADNQYGTLPEDQANAQALLYLEKALALDPNNAEALAGMGLVLSDDWQRLDESIDYLERALAINPNLIDASNWLQQALNRKHRHQDALAILEDMFERDPFYRPGFTNLSGTYRRYRRLEDAQRVLDRVRPFMQSDPFYIEMNSELLAVQGELARATVLAEEAFALHPNNFQARRGLGLRLMGTAQWERLLELGLPWQKIVALQELGRIEEATLLASKEAAEGGDFNALLDIYLSQGKWEEVMHFFRERWGSIDEFLVENPLERFDSVDSLMQLALASQKLALEDWHAQAMKLVRDKINDDLEEGFKMAFMKVQHARFYALAGEHETAIDALQQAYEWGFYASGDLRDWPEFDVLAGDPRFEAVQARMLAAVNREREMLGLGPIET